MDSTIRLRCEGADGRDGGWTRRVVRAHGHFFQIQVQNIIKANVNATAIHAKTAPTKYAGVLGFSSGLSKLIASRPIGKINRKQSHQSRTATSFTAAEIIPAMASRRTGQRSQGRNGYQKTERCMFMAVSCAPGSRGQARGAKGREARRSRETGTAIPRCLERFIERHGLLSSR